MQNGILQIKLYVKGMWELTGQLDVEIDIDTNDNNSEGEIKFSVSDRPLWAVAV